MQKKLNESWGLALRKLHFDCIILKYSQIKRNVGRMQEFKSNLDVVTRCRAAGRHGYKLSDLITGRTSAAQSVPSDAEPCHCHYDGEERAEKIEKAVGQIHYRGNVEHCGLCHAAGRPWYERACHGNRIFGGTAQKSGFISLAAVNRHIHASGENYGEILIGKDGIEESSRYDGGRHHRRAAADRAYKERSDGVQHAASVHYAAENHRADDEPHGVEHPGHAAGAGQILQRFIGEIK